MKNLNYFPFERNKYYYGKLLTEQNFIQEQTYFNDKRRVLSRFLFGEGVVRGLNVVDIDERTITVESGLALDFSGREIVVETPVTKKLFMMDGFDTASMEDGKEFVYLCIEYGEEEIDPSHNIAGSGVYQADHVDYDRVREGYHLYLTDKEPQERPQTPESLYQDMLTLYQENGLYVTQTVPKFVEAGQVFETCITVENTSGAKTVSIEIKEEMEGALCEGSDEIRAEWKKLFLDSYSKITKTFLCKAPQTGSVRLRVVPGQCQIWMDGWKKSSGEAELCFMPTVTDNSYHAISEEYFHGSIEQIMDHLYPQDIYLAKIYFIKTERVYMIDRIETMPYRQYAYGNSAMMGMVSYMTEEIRRMKKCHPCFEPSGGRISENRYQSMDKGPRVSHGKVVMDLGIGGKRGQRYQSEEILHELGLGPVKISVGIQEDNYVYSGSGEVFEPMGMKAELAVRLEPSKGSFVIGLRLLDASTKQTVTIHWTALANMEVLIKEILEQKIYIKPKVLELQVRSSYHLEAVCENIENTEVIWSVKSKEGGSIHQDGLYIAPNQPGVFEVMVQSQQYPDRKASLFVVVRE